MKRPEVGLRNKGISRLTILGLIALAAIGMPSITSAIGPGTVCVLQIQSSGTVLGLLVDRPTNFSVGVLVPEDQNKKMNLPFSCDVMGTLALAVANQENEGVTVTTRVFSNQGELICANGSVHVSKDGAQGIIFSGCQ
jgi:hypothetical protein